MKKVRIVGVPEHFNLPWHLAINEKAFEQRGIDLIWQDVAEGTGKMAKMLEDQSADLAVILTEGISRSIAEGNPALIVQEYVSTPLLWGIHVASGSEFKEINEMQGMRAAISRYGSGSHLMTYLMVEKYGWDAASQRHSIVSPRSSCDRNPVSSAVR